MLCKAYTVHGTMVLRVVCFAPYGKPGTTDYLNMFFFRTLLMYDSDFALVILPGWLTKAKTAKLPSATAVASDI